MRLWFAIMSTLCAVGAAIALASLVPSSTDAQPSTPDPTDVDIAPIETAIDDPVQQPPEQQSFEFKVWPEELEEFSWENPFEKRHWKLQGWSVDGNSLTGEDAAKGNMALFRKRYKKVMLEFDTVPLGDGGHLNIQCKKTEDTRQRFEVRFRNDQVDIVESDIGSPERNLSFSELDAPARFKRDNPRTVKLILTGNRLLVHINGKRIINCPQPILGTSPEFVFQLNSVGSVWHIAKLRIEGE